MQTLTFETEELSYIFFGDNPDFDVLEEGDWVDEATYETCFTIVKHVPTGKHYQMVVGRTYVNGDWTYDFDPDLVEVYKCIKVQNIETWEVA